MSIKNNLKSLSIKLFFGNTYLRNGVTFGKDSFIREHSQIGGGKVHHFGNPYTNISI